MFISVCPKMANQLVLGNGPPRSAQGNKAQWQGKTYTDLQPRWKLRTIGLSLAVDLHNPKSIDVCLLVTSTLEHGEGWSDSWLHVLISLSCGLIL